jgi:hypothetical protein
MTDAIEITVLEQFRWWPVSEMATTKEQLTPLSLSEIVSRYLEYGSPQEALEVEILTD